MLETLWLIFGLGLLWLGSELVIKSGETIASKFKVSALFIGLFVVSIGTSIPEIAVSITSGIDRLAGLETSGIAVGTTIGSCLNQITLIIGLLAIILTLRMGKQETLVHAGVLSASVLIFLVLAADGMLSPMDGFMFIATYLIYAAYLLGKEKSTLVLPKKENIHKDIFLLTIGILLIIYGSETVVENGVHLAQILGVKQSVIGILLVGLGTGLPEFTVAIAGARRKAFEIPMGMLIGSNVCDLLFATGTGAIITGFRVDKMLLLFDLPALLIFTLVFNYLLYTKSMLQKKEGLILIGIYFLYVLIKITIS